MMILCTNDNWLVVYHDSRSECLCLGNLLVHMTTFSLGDYWFGIPWFKCLWFNRTEI
ncbi:hypothetical protein HanIR_Chr14g0705061 [Helianthus annuus]|nr:hypothetical protein HanIR_Chr14g0705061 [Helianthus annuus]